MVPQVVEPTHHWQDQEGHDADGHVLDPDPGTGEKRENREKNENGNRKRRGEHEDLQGNECILIFAQKNKAVNPSTMLRAIVPCK